MTSYKFIKLVSLLSTMWGKWRRHNLQSTLKISPLRNSFLIYNHNPIVNMRKLKVFFSYFHLKENTWRINLLNYLFIGILLKSVNVLGISFSISFKDYNFPEGIGVFDDNKETQNLPSSDFDSYSYRVSWWLFYKAFDQTFFLMLVGIPHSDSLNTLTESLQLSQSFRISYHWFWRC